MIRNNFYLWLLSNLKFSILVVPLWIPSVHQFDLDFYHQVESPNQLPKVDFAGCSTSTIYSSQSWECMSYVSCGFDSGSHHGMWKMRENVIRYNLILKWWREGGGEKCWFKRKTFQNFLKRFTSKTNSLIWDVPCFEGFPWNTTMAARREHG